MLANDVLLDLIDDDVRRINQLLEEAPRECLHWQPDPQANSIAVTIWHVVRVFDVFKTQHIDFLSAEAEIWFSEGWVDKTGYDPRGLGSNGWGMVSGFTRDDVAGIPRFSKVHLQGYLTAVMGGIRDYVVATPQDVLAQTAPGFERRQTNYFWIKHPLFDMTRHIGEMYALQELWKRQPSGDQSA